MKLIKNRFPCMYKYKSQAKRAAKYLSSFLARGSSPFLRTCPSPVEGGFSFDESKGALQPLEWKTRSARTDLHGPRENITALSIAIPPPIFSLRFQSAGAKGYAKSSASVDEISSDHRRTCTARREIFNLAEPTARPADPSIPPDPLDHPLRLFSHRGTRLHVTAPSRRSCDPGCSCATVPRPWVIAYARQFEPDESRNLVKDRLLPKWGLLPRPWP